MGSAMVVRNAIFENTRAKNDIFGKEGGTGLEDRTQSAHHGLEDFDKHRGEMPAPRRSLDESRLRLGSVRLGTELLRRIPYGKTALMAP